MVCKDPESLEGSREDCSPGMTGVYNTGKVLKDDRLASLQKDQILNVLTTQNLLCDMTEVLTNAMVVIIAKYKCINSTHCTP